MMKDYFSKELSMETSEKLVSKAHTRGFKVMRMDSNQVVEIVEKQFAL
jgi:hypothetical protein